VVLSDDAGQFNVGHHALCWVHAERLVHKLDTFTDKHRAAQTRVRSLRRLTALLGISPLRGLRRLTALLGISPLRGLRRLTALLGISPLRGLIWNFYASLKAYRLKPSPRRAVALSKRFDRIFLRRTGFVTLDRLLKRLHANKAELLMVLDRPQTPLHTNGSENDIRCYVTRRKVSAGTRSEVAATVAMLFSGSPRPATSLASRSGIISAAGSRWRGTLWFSHSTVTSERASGPPDGGRCPRFSSSYRRNSEALDYTRLE
jgi:hypothetical protein